MLKTGRHSSSGSGTNPSIKAALLNCVYMYKALRSLVRGSEKAVVPHWMAAATRCFPVAWLAKKD